MAAYFVGSFPTSYLAARFGAGIDLREHGSKNLGATNLYRVLGWKYAIPVGLVDAAKGALPVLVFAPRAGAQPWMPIVVGSAAVVGHVFPLFLGFRGGKGVATAAGVLLALAPEALGVSAIVWAVLVKLTGYVSLGSIVGAAVFPVVVWLTRPGDVYTIATGSVLAAIILFTHRANIRRLLAGSESRFGRRASAVGENQNELTAENAEDAE